MNDLLKYWHMEACQLTPNSHTYMSILEALVSVKLAPLTPKNVSQCFVLKSTTGKYISINKKAMLGPFCHLLNKDKIHEAVKVKGELVSEGETIGYW